MSPITTAPISTPTDSDRIQIINHAAREVRNRANLYSLWSTCRQLSGICTYIMWGTTTEDLRLQYSSPGVMKCNHAIYLKGWEPEWSDPQTINLPLLDLESGLKCVSGQGEHSVNPKNLVFPTRDISLFWYLAHISFCAIAHSGSQPFNYLKEGNIYQV